MLGPVTMPRHCQRYAGHRMHQVFISYSTKDEHQARQIVEGLERLGHRCWIASRDISDGGAFNREITTAIESAELVVLVFSRDADDSEEVQREMSLAAKYTKRICPINLDGYAPINLQYWLLTTQWLTLQSHNDFSDLALAISRGFLGGRELAQSTKAIAASLRIRATRFIPVFVGYPRRSILSKPLTEEALRGIFEAQLAKVVDGHKLEVRRGDDGVCVIALREEADHASAVHFARHRRSVHQAILRAKHIIDDIKIDKKHPLFLREPPGVDYVMSVHQVLNAHEVPITHIYAIAEPSLIGITDDPSLSEADEQDALSALHQIRANDALRSIAAVPTKRNTYYISWSNVVLCDPEAGSGDYKLLEDLEFELQRIWYKLYFYSKYTARCIDRRRGFDVRKCRDRVRSALAEYLSFSEFTSVGARHANQLKAELIRTSKLDGLADALSQKEKLL